MLPDAIPAASKGCSASPTKIIGREISRVLGNSPNSYQRRTPLRDQATTPCSIRPKVFMTNAKPLSVSIKDTGVTPPSDRISRLSQSEA